MKKVKSIPDIERAEPRRDPWIDALLDGELYQLDASDWGDRYATPRSGASAIKEAGVKRGIVVTTAVRGENLYVQAELNGQKPKAAKKAAPKKAAPRKAVAKKAVPPK